MNSFSALSAQASTEAKLQTFSWGPVIGTILVWIAIFMLGIQTWQDKRAAEQRSYDHLLDAAHQIESNVAKVYASNRLLGETLADLVRRPATAGCTLVCNQDLQDVQKRFTEILPGTELLILDASGRAVAETERDMRQHLPLLNTTVQRFLGDRGLLADVRYGRNTRNEPAFIMARALRSASGDLQAILMLVQPVAVLEPNFDLPQLGQGRSVTVLDTSNTLIIRQPDPVTAQIGQPIPTNMVLAAGPLPGSYFGQSPFDDKTRLVIKRTLPFALSSGGLTLYLGMDTEDYLAAWRHSTAINLGLGLLLLTGWIWGMLMLRKVNHYHAQLQASIAVTQKIQEEIPLPLFLVNQSSNTIVRSNIAMIETFGALAGEGQPVSRLFRDNSDWTGLPSDNEVSILEMVTRHGTIHAELHRTALDSLNEGDSPFWLVTLVDVSESYLQTQQLQQEATTDTLTGLANRRHFYRIAEQDIKKSQKSGESLAVLSLDIDHFKRVNDQYGHDSGDLVLSLVAQIFKSCMREEDLAARMGGEEFSALLPGAGPEMATLIGERIRKAVSVTPIILPDGRALNVTISIGVSLWQADDVDIQDALKRSDLALYAAKEQGRNRVISFDPLQHSTESGST